MLAGQQTSLELSNGVPLNPERHGGLLTKGRLAMTEREILQEIASLQAMLDEIRAGNVAYSVSASQTEAEKERQHQEDLQRLRGLRLIDDDFMKLTSMVTSMARSYCSRSSWTSRTSESRA